MKIRIVFVVLYLAGSTTTEYLMRISTPWQLVRERLLEGRTPDPVRFARRHGLKLDEVVKLFSGVTISFSLPMCEALHKDTGMSKKFFRNLNNRWPPHPPPATSMALLGGPFLFSPHNFHFLRA